MTLVEPSQLRPKFDTIYSKCLFSSKLICFFGFPMLRILFICEYVLLHVWGGEAGNASHLSLCFSPDVQHTLYPDDRPDKHRMNGWMDEEVRSTC